METTSAGISLAEESVPEAIPPSQVPPPEGAEATPATPLVSSLSSNCRGSTAGFPLASPGLDCKERVTFAGLLPMSSERCKWEDTSRRRSGSSVCVATLTRVGKGMDSFGVSGSPSLASLMHDMRGGRNDTPEGFTKWVTFKGKPGDDKVSSSKVHREGCRRRW